MPTRQQFQRKVQAFNRRPLIQRQQRTADIPALGLPTAFGRQAHANIERAQQRELDPQAKQIYRQHLSKLWSGASKYYGANRGKMPKATFTKDPSEMPENIGAQVPNTGRPGQRPVRYNIETARNYATMPGAPSVAQRSSLPLHEWAHTIQRYKGLPERQVESGADAYAKRTSRRLGLPGYKTSYPQIKTPRAYGIRRAR